MAKIRKKRSKRVSRTRRTEPTVWQLDAVVGQRKTENDEPVCAIMLVDTTHPEPLAVEMCLPDQVAERTTMVLRRESERRKAQKGVDPWPNIIQVRDPGLAQFLDPLAKMGVRVEQVETLDHLIQATQRLVKRVKPETPKYFVPDLPVGLYEAIAEFVDAAPWSTYSERHLLEVERTDDPDAPFDFPVISVLGGAGRLTGITLHRSLERFAALMEANDLAGFEALHIWLHEASQIDDTQKQLFADAGWARTDVYPAILHQVPAEQPTMSAPSDEHAAALTDAIDALLLFFGDHAEPPAADTKTVARWDDGREVAVYHRPQLAEVPVIEFDAIAPFDLQLFLMDLGVDDLASFNSELGDAGISDGEIEALGDGRVVACAIRGRKADATALMQTLERADALGYIPPERLTTFETEEGEGVLVAFDGDEIIGGIIACSPEFANDMTAAADASDGRPAVVFSGGGTRLKPGKVRGRDALSIRRLAWRPSM